MIQIHVSPIVKVILFAFLLFSISLSYAQFAGGTGTEADPYLIANATHLNNVRNYLNSCFLQIADVDLGVAPYNQGTGWETIGTFISDLSTANIPFQGIYDGSGLLINNLIINRPNDVGQGLFACTNEAIIKNVILLNVNIIADSYGGAVAAFAKNSTFNNCTIDGTITAHTNIGGLIGKTNNVNISNCSIQGQMNGTYNYTGGLVGYCQGGSISSSNAYGRVSCDCTVGGLIGANSGTNVTDCYTNVAVTGATISTDGYDIGGFVGVNYYNASNYVRCFAVGNVTGSGHMGGFGGHVDISNLTDCFSSGNVSWNATATYSSNGGFIGVDQECIITNCYSTGLVNAGSGSFVGGFIGSREGLGTITGSYWNTETSGHTYSDGGVGRTTDDMTYPYAANTYLNWDFTSVWIADVEGINCGYPFLNEQAIPNSVYNPTFSPIGGNYVGSIFVTIQTLTPDAAIYYTVNETDPTPQSYLYSDPILIDATTVIKARAYKDGCFPSVVSTAVYTFNTPVNDNITFPAALSCIANPNPFNPSTTITFNLPKAAKAALDIYNLKGQKICTLANDNFSKGEHSFRWNGKTDDGIAVPSGMYLYKLQGTGFEITHKLTLMK